MAPQDLAPERKPLVKARGIRWDLRPIHRDADEARAALAQEVADAADLQARFQGKITGLDAAGLATLLRELGALTNRSQATSSYAELRYLADSSLPENQDLRAAADQAGVQFANLTRFFDLEWKALPADHALALAASPELRGDQHFLERLIQDSAHTLSAPEEEALAERSPAAVSAWQQLFSQTTSAITVEFTPDSGIPTTHTIAELRAYLDDDRSDVRKRALEALYSALEPWAPVLARIYDTLVGDRLVLDRLRHFVTSGEPPKPLPMQQANLANDLSDTIVDTLIDSVEAHYSLAQRYFRIKAAKMGLKTLLLSDQYAPVGKARTYTFDQASQLVLDSARRFSPEAEQILARFFTEHRIDAEPRKAKQGGAFCAGVAQDKSPYVLLNFTDSKRDLETLAHELGHGLHCSLAQGRQSPFSYETGMAIAEVASTFAEQLLFDDLLEGEADPEVRGALIGSRVERSFLTVFTQTTMTRYEQRSYAAKEKGESLNPDRLSRFWVEENRKYYGDMVELPVGYHVAWSAIPHFISTRFYTYSYAFADLAALALYAKYREDQAAFVPRYLELLGAGGSRSPAELLAPLGIDIWDRRWVDPAFALIKSWIDLAEQSWVGAGSRN